MKPQLKNLVISLNEKCRAMKRQLLDPADEFNRIINNITAKIFELDQEIETEGYTTAFGITEEIYPMWEWLWDRNYAFIKKDSLNEFDEVLGEIYQILDEVTPKRVPEKFDIVSEVNNLINPGHGK